MRLFRSILQITFCSLLVLLSPLAAAQPCEPHLDPRFTTGPWGSSVNTSWINSMLRFQDADGPSLVVTGSFYLPPFPPGTPKTAAQYKDGRWTILPGLPVAGPNMPLAQADFSSVGGHGPSIYAATDAVRRWTGSEWQVVGDTALTTTLLISHTDSQGPLLLAARNDGIFAWRGSGVWTLYAPPLPTMGVTKLRVLDDGSGPAVFVIGTLRDTTRGINMAAKLVAGDWVACPTPSGNHTLSDYIFFNDGTSTNGPEPYVTGSFPLNGVTQANAARFRNGSWEVLGGGVTTYAASSLPFWSIIDEGSGPTLHLAGPIKSPLSLPTYQGLLRWTATGWQTPLHLFNASTTGDRPPRAIIRFDDGDGEKTYIGGHFSAYAPEAVPTTRRAATTFGLIRGEGSTYQTVSSGLGEGGQTSLVNELAAVTLNGSPQLIATGSLTRAGGVFAVGAARFDGSAWSPLHRSLSTSAFSVVGSPVAFAIAGQERLLAARFTGGIDYWDGAQWVVLSTTGSSSIGRLTVFNNELYGARIGTQSGYLQRYNATGWSLAAPFTETRCFHIGDLGQGPRLFIGANGPDGPGVYEFDGVNTLRLGALPSPAYSIVVHNDNGTSTLFASIGTSGPSAVARWDGSAWQPFMNIQSFITDTPATLASFDDGRGPALYIAGPLTASFGPPPYTPASHILRWRSGEWAALGPYEPTPPRFPASMATFDNRLYIAGAFTSFTGYNADGLIVLEPCPRTCTADFNNDGDTGTDADIEAFFQCLAGNCCDLCTADFNNDGDTGTDADIESFFRVLAGGPC